MTMSWPDYPAEVADRFDDHLDGVDDALVATGLPARDRRQIIDDLKAQMIEMLAARAEGAPTAHDAEELDPPAAYGEGDRSSLASSEQPHAGQTPRPFASRLGSIAWVLLVIAVAFVLGGLIVSTWERRIAEILLAIASGAVALALITGIRGALGRAQGAISATLVAAVCLVAFFGWGMFRSDEATGVLTISPPPPEAIATPPADR